jgi:hypothetical protein
VTKYGGTTRTKLDHLAHYGMGTGRFTQTDLIRLWELAKAAEDLETLHNPVHARQRLRRAVEALREASVGGLPPDPPI